jgi:nicotinamide-nucleotide amidase
MRAAILSIGDELTLGQNLNTNSQWLADELARRGIVTIEHRTVDDDRARIAHAVAALAAECDVLIVTGGLGPTDDDLTRDAINDAIEGGKPMVQDEQARQWLEQWFAGRDRSMPETNLRQTMRPRSMRCLPNPHGTAPGLAGVLGQCLISALPGPPREMRPMFFDHVVPELPIDENAEVLLTATIHEFGMGESVAAKRLGGLTDRSRHPLIGTTVSDLIVTARIRARGRREEIEPLVEADCMEIQQRWWPYAFGRDDETLSLVIARLLLERGRTLATAESCTGGWLGKMIVDLAGSSAYYRGGWVTYSNEMKASQLGVPMDLIEREGAVSSEVAAAMAIGALERSGADEAISITGIAGPDGGSPEKPVGSVHIGLASRMSGNIIARTRHFRFTGDRTTIRDRSAKAALQMLRFALLDVDDSHELLWEVKGQVSGVR